MRKRKTFLLKLAALLLPALPWVRPAAAQDTDYVVRFSAPVVTDASQFYCNNKSTEGTYEALIDGDPNTHFISAYSEGRETSAPDEYHYLQVYDESDLPDRLVIHWRTRGSTWSNMYRPIHVLLSASKDSTEWDEIGEWKNPEAGFPVTADMPEYTSPVITLGDGYHYFRLTVLETNTGETFEGHPFFNFAGYNLYPVVEKGQESLADMLNAMTFGPDDYLYGTDPGFIGDRDKWDNFERLYQQALQFVAEGGHSEEELEELKQKLVAAEEETRNAVNEIKDGGYYYIKTANTAFTDASKEDYGWYAPSDGQNHVGWKAVEESGSFMWKAEKDGAGWKLRNALTGLCVGRPETNALSQPAQLDEAGHRQLVKRLNYAGVMSIEWDGAVAVWQQGGADSPSAESGSVVTWNGGAGTASSWYLREIPAETAQELLERQNLDLLKSYLSLHKDLPDSYSVGDKVGQLNSQEAYDNLKKAYDDAAAALEETHTPEEYGALLTSLKEAVTEADSNATNRLEEGYYRFATALPEFLEDDSLDLKTLSWAHHVSNPSVIEWAKDDGTADYIWKISFADNPERFYIQNASTKQYISCGATLQPACNISSTPEPETEHYLVLLNHHGVVNVYNTDYPANPYHALGWDNPRSETMSGTVCYAAGDPSKWFVVPVDDEEAERLMEEAINRNRIDTLKSLVAASQAKILEATVHTYDFDSPLISDPADIFSNAQAYTDKESTSYGNLIDGNYGTIFHSRYNSITPIDDYHYLRVHVEDGLPEKFGIHWAKRCFDANESNNAVCRPTKIVIGMSADTVNWEKLDTLTVADGLPTVTTDTFYTSKQPIEGEAKYKYFIMKVLEVNNDYDMSDGYGHPFFTMSEYNLYPYKGVDPASQINDTAVKDAIDGLEAAIAKARGVIESGKVGDSDIPDLQAAYSRLLDAWKDTTELSMLLKESNMYSNLTEGDGSVVGDVPYDAIEKMGRVVEETGLNGKLLYTLTKPEIDSLTAVLKAARKEFLGSVTQPEPGVWYVIQTAEDNEERAGKIMNAGGKSGHSPNSGAGRYSYWLDKYTEEDIATDPLSEFVFKANDDGTLTMQNVGSGFFLGPETGSGNTTYDYRPIQWYEPHPVQLIPFGDGQVGFRLESGRYIRGNASWYADGMTYEVNSGDKPYANSAFAWKVLKADELTYGEITETVNVEQGAIAITRPYDLEGLPTVGDGSAVKGYRIVGKITGEGSSDSIVTGYKLREYDDEMIPAGTPVIYMLDKDAFDKGGMLTLTFRASINGAVTNLPDTVNGLAGGIDYVITDVNHTGKFEEDSVADAAEGTSFDPGRGYIIPWLVADDEASPYDAIIYVKGNGMLNSIKAAAVEDQREAVDVYSIDGILLRHGVKRSEATEGLAPGVYIVGKRKVLVK